MKNFNQTTTKVPLFKMARLLLFCVLIPCITAVLPSCKKNQDQEAPAVTYTPQAHLTGVGALSGMLDKTKFTMASIIQVDLDHDVARLPLYKGTYNGATVWYVRTDVSDSVIAKQLGLNFIIAKSKSINFKIQKYKF